MFKTSSTDWEVEQLKTRRHEREFSMYESLNGRIGYVLETTQTFDLNFNLLNTKRIVRSWYFGFANSAQADRFEDWAKHKFSILDAIDFDSHCEARLSKRLATPFEVKIRNLEAISKDLEALAIDCLARDAAPKVAEMPVAEVKRKLARL